MDGYSDYDVEITAARYAGRLPDSADGLGFAALAQLLPMPSEVDCAVDVGCGTGRSTRFLTGVGYRVVGVDPSGTMLEKARALDPRGDYRRITDGVLPLPSGSADLVVSTWVLCAIRTEADLEALLAEMRRISIQDAQVFILTNTPDFYLHRYHGWENDLARNRKANQAGDSLSVTLQPEGIALVDYMRTDSDYRTLFHRAGFSVEDAYLVKHTQAPHCPAPFVIYRLRLAKV